MSQENYSMIKGDATQPEGPGNKIIAHVCNDIGAWGAGFVVALSKRWAKPEAEYRKWFENTAEMKSPIFDKNGPGDLDGRGVLNPALGNLQLVEVQKESDETIFVANMIAQRNVRSDNYNRPLRYSALFECLKVLADLAKSRNASIHCPKFGSGLAGGNWEFIEIMIQECLADQGIQVVVYEF